MKQGWFAFGNDSSENQQDVTQAAKPSYSHLEMTQKWLCLHRRATQNQKLIVGIWAMAP